MSVVITQRKMAHARDPGEVIAEAVGNLDDYFLFHNLVLLGVYKRPEKTHGGIILTENTKKEDVFQGIAGYVLKVGPAAFQNDEHNNFYGCSVSPGDWVVYRTSDTWLTSINGQECRIVEDAKVKAKIQHPDMVF
jgi:co-chaperonin GroES (HSP10)